MDLTFRSSYPSLTRSVWSARFDKLPSPRLVFLPWYRNSWGVTSKTRLNPGHVCYLRRAIRDTSYIQLQFIFLKSFHHRIYIPECYINSYILKSYFKYDHVDILFIIFTEESTTENFQHFECDNNLGEDNGGKGLLGVSGNHTHRCSLALSVFI